jgi:hypothetical protein
MNHFKRLLEFEKEFKVLLKKYRSLDKDIEDFESFIRVLPTGAGKNFTIIYSREKVKLVKARLACKSLRDRSMRIIYAYHDDVFTFVYIEIYFKGNKENEDKTRVQDYIKSLK